MTADNGWDSWGDAWREDGPAPAFDVAEIEARVRRQQFWQTLRDRIDLGGSLLALVVCVWVIAKADTPGVVLGLAGLAFTFFGLVVTLGRERAPSALASRTVAAALDWELATARAAVRSAVGGMAMAVAALAFLAVCTVVFRLEGMMGRATYPLAAALLFTVGSGCVSAWNFRRRRARVRRLEALLADLTGA